MTRHLTFLYPRLGQNRLPTGLRATDTYPGVFNYDKTSCQLHQLEALQQAPQDFGDPGRALICQSHHDYSWVRTGREGSEVAEILV